MALQLRPRKRVLAGTICLCFFIVALFSLLFITTHMHHQCTVAQCATCLRLESAKNALEQLGTGTPAGALFLWVFTALALSALALTHSGKAISLVALKIRLDS